jgi:hypothetical protein
MFIIPSSAICGVLGLFFDSGLALWGSGLRNLLPRFFKFFGDSVASFCSLFLLTDEEPSFLTGGTVVSHWVVGLAKLRFSNKSYTNSV